MELGKWLNWAKGGYGFERKRSHFQKGKVTVDKVRGRRMGDLKCQRIQIDFVRM